ncbi:hypothetical protein CROQUDRAFT_76101 [Cronartium quercuum f. sp. fusiforme G11]|uniref:RING-type domain-containing protein n=1 Tax=Cronartium quercuum f. sp. fusiforme G11 TaxID=708437 RepID=A0A9P6TEJ6_9BASI|nr:hypothetical protein CROQUDRAFT_76101 [Cronartium quercuum f. sp. fusiforme G11]
MNTSSKSTKFNSRSNNLNHLLGFTLTPRSNHFLPTLGNTKPNKDAFVHAQYRFILNPTGDYNQNLKDADLKFNWPDILQVILHIPFTNESICPICLSNPISPRITKCGHIFCYSCLLHYLDQTEKEEKGIGRKCPVCNEHIIFKKDLKSLKYIHVHELNQNQSFSFELIHRFDQNILALPKSSNWSYLFEQQQQDHHHHHEIYLWDFWPQSLEFAKFILGTPDYFKQELNLDLNQIRKEIQNELKLKEDLIGLEFLKLAENKVMEQISKVEKLNTFKVTNKIKESRELLEKMNQINSFEPSNLKSFQFYQSSSGQNIFLAPLDVRILLKKYGTYSNFPNQIILTVESINEDRISEYNRKRYKYLSHLSIGTHFKLVETNLEKVLVDLNDHELLQAFRLRRRKRLQVSEREEWSKIKSEKLILNNQDDLRGSNRFDDEESFNFNNHNETITSVNRDLIPSSSRTVWGTPQIQQHQSESDQNKTKDVWTIALEKSENEDVDVQTININKKKKKKGKVVINISGGNGGRGRIS